ncbi:iron transporter [Haloglomus litoreum]|uniref:iron transporter n=1 Tax=Haloglomus litoreum TaxID=3034026 RepID=UPI0023E83B35|nr:iron transporter [Haloglomus sp. DT116]
MRRRTFLRAGALAGSAAISGCVYGGMPFQRRSGGRMPPVVDYRPDTVYRPTLATGMELVDTTTAGPFGLAVTYSHPGRFWNVTGTRSQLTGVEADDDVHLMVTVWERESGLVLPEAGVTAELTRDGDLVSEEVVYPMLAQRMGFHYGGNFSLAGDGRYTVRIRVGGLRNRRVGALEGRLSAPATAAVAFDYSRRERERIERRRVSRAGDPGALARAVPDTVPPSTGRPPADLPGRHLGTARTGGLDLAVLAVSRDDLPGDPYLAVSARTVHNRLVVPSMGLAATVQRDGATTFDGSLTRTLGPDLGYHYGAGMPSLRDGDRLRLRVTVPPQVARHEGYETAFFDLPAVSLRVETGS